MATNSKGVTVKVTDMVVIESQGVSRSGIVTYADLDGEHWMIEFRGTDGRGPGYWKQRYDGGRLVSVHDTPCAE